VYCNAKKTTWGGKGRGGKKRLTKIVQVDKIGKSLKGGKRKQISYEETINWSRAGGGRGV